MIKPNRFPFALPFVILQWTALGAVDVTVSRIGYLTVGGEDVIRHGRWAPVVVDLSLLNESAFDGTVRVGQFDGDGDAAIDAVEVHLSAESGGTRRVVLFALPFPVDGQAKFTVELHDALGQSVEFIAGGERVRRARPGKPPTLIKDDDLLILSVSSGTLGRLNNLVDTEKQSRYRRALHLAHVSPSDLPEHALGLETVDVICWDDAAPNQLTERQLSALIEWVRQGGTLWISASPADGSFAAHKALDAILPVTVGSLVSVDRLEALYDRFLGVTQGSAPAPHYDPPIPIVQCKARDGSQVFARDDAGRSDLITSRQEGRGTVIFCGVTEKNLLRGVQEDIVLYEQLLQIGYEPGGESTTKEYDELFPAVARTVSFAISGSGYLMAAALFSVGYVVLATVGAWRYLGTHGWRQHSWTAFAAFGGAATLLSILGVNSIRGFGDRVHQVSILDAHAGQSFAHATTLFGFKTGTDKLLDVWLPSHPTTATEPGPSACFLRPVPVEFGMGEAATSFADPQEYRLRPGSAVIEDLRIRGTLKQLEGRWHGSMTGRISARVTLRPHESSTQDWRITEESYIVNELGVPLRGCYLLMARTDTVAPIGRNANLEKNLPRDSEIYAYRLGDLSKDPVPVPLAPQCYKPDEGQTEFRPFIDWLLRDKQRNWTNCVYGPFARSKAKTAADENDYIGQPEAALLLLSTLGEYDSGTNIGTFGGISSWSRDRLRQLDLREKLQRDCAYFVGFADDPGPVRLFRRQGDRPYSPVEPEAGASLTLVRVRIPLTILAD